MWGIWIPQTFLLSLPPNHWIVHGRCVEIPSLFCWEAGRQKALIDLHALAATERIVACYVPQGGARLVTSRQNAKHLV